MLLDLDTLAVQSFSTTSVEEGLNQTETDTINTGPGGKYTLCYICPGSAYCASGENVCV